MPGNSTLERTLSKKDRLLAHLNGLSSETEREEMEEMWKRYEFIEDKLRSMNKKNAMEVVRKKYSISRAQSYRLIKEVENFSGLAHAPDKDYLRWVHLEKIQMAIDLAIAKGDLNAFSRISDQLHKWLHQDGEIDLEILDKLQPRQFNMQVVINGENIQLDLEQFYKLQDKHRKAINQSSTEEIAPWDEIKLMLDAKE